jgi:hypothetical protein
MGHEQRSVPVVREAEGAFPQGSLTQALRPLLARELLASSSFRDQLSATLHVGATPVEIGTYGMAHNRTYSKGADTGNSAKQSIEDRHRAGTTEGWGTIYANFTYDPPETDTTGEAVTARKYTFFTPEELDLTWNAYDLAAVFGVTARDVDMCIINAQEPITTPEQLQEALVSDATTRRDLTKPVVTARTFYQDSRRSQTLLLDERTEENGHHFDRLEALYHELRK